MSKVNHFAVSAILNSEIVGRGKFGHGQINSLGDGQRYLEMLEQTESPAALHQYDSVDPLVVVRAFHEIRDARGDRGSTDLYIADPERNALFVARCRELGLNASEYTLNKTLMNARRTNRLKHLDSAKTAIDYDDFAFACEFAATELKYKTGASIDDILCDPGLASRFDSIARAIAPGHTSFEFRWAILSIRKASGRSMAWKDSYRMPKFTRHLRLAGESLDDLPQTGGAYLLYEDRKNRPLYARASAHLRRAVEFHRRPEMCGAILERLWMPDLSDLVISFAEIADKQMLKPVEKRIIEEKKPLFNVPRAA